MVNRRAYRRVKVNSIDEHEHEHEHEQGQGGYMELVEEKGSNSGWIS